MNAYVEREIIPVLYNPQVAAFERVVREWESSQDDMAYRALFGWHPTKRPDRVFESFADHPRVRTYEAYDGQFIKNGKIDYTTAAGAVQWTASTWEDVLRRTGWMDFSPRSQRIAFVDRLIVRKALPAVLDGYIPRACELCRDEWVSLPTSTNPQGSKATIARAIEVFKAYGGIVKADISELKLPPAPEPTPEAIPEPIDEPAPPAKERSMDPFTGTALWGLASKVIDLFTPLAREKIEQRVGKHTTDPAIAKGFAEAVLGTAKALTGKTDPIEAVVAMREAPKATVAEAERTVLDQLDRLGPILDRLDAMDRTAWAAEEASRDAASARAERELGPDQDPVLTRSIIALMAVIALSLGVAVVVLAYNGKAFGEVLGLFGMLVGVIAGKFGTRYDHRYGSSRGSSSKDIVISELSKKKV